MITNNSQPPWPLIALNIVIYFVEQPPLYKGQLELAHRWLSDKFYHMYGGICLRQPPVGQLQLTFIERWLLYRGRLQCFSAV